MFINHIKLSTVRFLVNKNQLKKQKQKNIKEKLQNGKKKENTGILKIKNLKKNKQNLKQGNNYMKISYENQI